MSTLVSLLLLLVFLAGGFAAVRLGFLTYAPVADRIFSVALYLLLFSMGLRLGQSSDVLSNLSLVGALAVSSTLFACAGTVLLHLLFAPVYRRLDRVGLSAAASRAGEHAGSGACVAAGDVPSATGSGASAAESGASATGSGASATGSGASAAESGASGNTAASGNGLAGPRGTRSMAGSRRLAMLFYNLKKPLILLVLVVIGTGVGYLLPPVTILKDGTVATWILYFLLFIIGMQMAGCGSDIGKLLCRPTVLLVPAVTVVGTLAGSLGTLLFDGMTPGRSLALGAGFGWYSLSGVLITDLGDPMLGAASFLANLFRETLAFLMVPLLAATGRCESGIGISGATSMDVTLPVVEDTWGPQVLPLSVAHGVVLSFLVPFLVPLFMSF